MPTAVCFIAEPELRERTRRGLTAAGVHADFIDVDATANQTAGLSRVAVVERPSEHQAAFGHAKTMGAQGASVVLLGESLEHDAALRFLAHSGIDHLLGEVSETGRELTVTSRKIATGDIFGLEKYLALTVTIHEQLVAGYDAKRAALDALSNYAQQRGVRRQTLARLESVADELVMNAIYDAPTIRKQQKPSERELPTVTPEKKRADSLSRLRALGSTPSRPGLRARTDSVQRIPAAALQTPAPAPQAPARLRYAADDDVFALSVKDSYGELRKQSILDNLQRARATGGNPLLPGGSASGGAGLGLYFILSQVSHFIANVNPGIATEVICLFDMQAVGRRRTHCARSLQVFTA